MVKMFKNVSKNDWKLIVGGVGIKMSWVDKNRKINNSGEEGVGEGGGDYYSGLESIVTKSYILDVSKALQVRLCFTYTLNTTLRCA